MRVPTRRSVERTWEAAPESADAARSRAARRTHVRITVIHMLDEEQSRDRR
jgi:hypothetical protein